jgi:hypothetical protein
MWKEEESQIFIHSWVYDLDSGYLSDLNFTVSPLPIPYRYCNPSTFRSECTLILCMFFFVLAGWSRYVAGAVHASGSLTTELVALHRVFHVTLPFASHLRCTLSTNNSDI